MTAVNGAKKHRVLLVGAGTMGRPHGIAYHRHPDFEVVGVVGQGPKRRTALAEELGGVPTFSELKDALSQTRPDAVCISTYPDTHERFATLSLEAGAHVFVEKPMARDVDGALRVIDTSRRCGRALLVGYILRVHPVWQAYVQGVAALGAPRVLRFSLNQQSSEQHYRTHLRLLSSENPVVDSGVHYVDVMCQMVPSPPIRVQAVGARLLTRTPEQQFDYGQLQLTFEDGSVGWFEAGWGPMMSRHAESIRDVVGPLGSLSLIQKERGTALVFHSSALDEQLKFVSDDKVQNYESEPGLLELCFLEQELFLQAIRGEFDLAEHHAAAVRCLRIVKAAEESMRTSRSISLLS